MATKQPGYDIVVTTAVELLGVGLFGILAGMSDEMGSIMIVIMWGFVIGWLLVNYAALGKLVGNL